MATRNNNNNNKTASSAVTRPKKFIVCLLLKLLFTMFFFHVYALFFAFRSLPYPTEKRRGYYVCVSLTNTSRLEGVVAWMRNRDLLCFFSVDNGRGGMRFC